MNEKSLTNIALGLCALGLACLAVGSIFLKNSEGYTIDLTTPKDSNKNVIVNLEPGEKLQTINWERNNNHGYLYILTRPMRPNEYPEIYKYQAISNSYADVYEIHERDVVGNK